MLNPALKAAFRNKFAVSGLVLALLLAVFLFLNRAEIREPEDLVYGATFSKKQAEDLGLDWRVVYTDMLDDLGVRNLRLSSYWNQVETVENSYDWSDTDWQIEEAAKRDVRIILAVGGRLPRWPECHWPEWSNGNDKAAREEKLLGFIRATIERYKDNRNIIAWQIENEPFLRGFGICPDLDVGFFDEELALARSLDARPIVVTDSGELSVWVPAAKRADIFGTTMYRDTYSSHLDMYIHYPIGPWFFKVKKNLANYFAKPDKWVVIELQGEPWGPEPFQNLSKTERDRTMDEGKFREIIEFARQTGFSEFYLWGVEWWYWEKATQNNPNLWAEAKKLFNKTGAAN